MPSPHSAVPWLQRQLLPAALTEPSQDESAARDRVIDGALVLVAAVLGGVSLASSSAGRDAWSLWLNVGVGLIACAALALRRRHPTAVALLALAAGTVSVLAGFAGLIALFNAAVRSSPRALAWIFALSLVSNAIYPLLYADADLGGYWGTMALCVLVMSVAIGWGLFARTRRELVASLHERARRLESEQLLRVEQARVAESRRIAREMHDVLAHRISLLSLHAGALEFRPDAPPEEIARAAEVIRASARQALQDLRAVIGMLRDGTDGEAPQPPQPTLAGLPGLLEESRAAGMLLHADIRVADPAAVPELVGRNALRIVQEALTNARKHAASAAVELRLEGAPGKGLTIEVRNRAAVLAAGGTKIPGSGTGLVGLAERAALSGGHLDHGLDANGDFRLHAWLPWPE